MKSFLMAAMTVFLLAGCGTGDDTAGADPDQDPTATPTDGITEVSTPETRLLDAREDWKNAGIDHYRWRYEQLCFCPPLDMRIEVQGDAMVDATNLAAPKAEAAPEIVTMEDLFDQVETALRDSATVRVTYDPETGAVRSLEVDHITNAVDDEYTIKVVGVTPR
ncbi:MULTISPECIES: DUF6174 domain-containing protein [unclassified Nocardioides]|uniref:DUF6174 domain-containing protein n=1 Tax=unclassified Nocardioides TaxID=2615069 RepID=UPI0006F2D04C|nr:MULTISPECIES: DUF6174 domain-containing protein [unclassified Nocardioides]KQY64404.1 hypothetical protein ASD30_05560 [Nocardioides sp. Root140]KRF18175.1 hypothetical protein ASH02_00945 [Nocardioides sp. Soil796]